MTIRGRLAAALLAFGISLPATAGVEGCGPEDLEAWARLYTKNPGDDDITGLFILHQRLCEMVEAGQMDVERASSIFESWRGRLAREWGRENERGVLKP
jgi:hypothetical protein